MPVLPKNSLVLVTGANGWIASHIIDQLIQSGYRVRGTCRSAAKAEWLVEYINNKYGENKLEIAMVPEMSVAGAFDQAVKGTSAFMHVAADLSMSTDADTVISNAVNGALGALAAATTEPAMKHFVYTSSSAAARDFEVDIPRDIYADSWPDVIDLAHAPGPAQALYVYSASKVCAEKAVFNYATEHNPHFVVNSVVPNFNLGPLLAPGRQNASSGQIIPAFYEKGWESLAGVSALGPQHYVNVRDTARLHIAPLLDPSLRNERLFAIVAPFTWNEVLAVLKTARPNHPLPEPDNDSRRDRHRFHASKRSEAILKKVFGRQAWVTFEETVVANIQHLK